MQLLIKILRFAYYEYLNTNVTKLENQSCVFTCIESNIESPTDVDAYPSYAGDVVAVL